MKRTQLIMNTDNTLKQSSKDYVKTATMENEYNKLENSQPQIENLGNIENKIKINEKKQNIITESLR